MNRFSFFSLRTRITLLVFAAVLPSLLIIGYSGLEHIRHDVDQAQQHALDLAEGAANLWECRIRDARQILFTLSQLPQVQQHDKAACTEVFSNLRANSEGYTGFLTVSPNGDLLTSSFSLDQPHNFTDKPWFREVLKRRDFVMGTYEIGPLSGKAICPLAYPALDHQGRVVTVIIAGLDLTYRDFFASINLPAGTTVRVVDKSGTVLMRTPDPAKWVGQSFPHAPVIERMLAQKKGVIEAKGLDGIRRLYGLAPLVSGATETFLSVGIPRSVAFIPVARSITIYLILAGIAAAAVMLAAWFFGGWLIVRPAQRLLKATRRLQEGDLSARTGITGKKGEINELARAFDQMAEGLEKSESERRAAESKLRESEQQFQVLFDNVFDVVYTLDLQLRIQRITPSVERVLGYPPHELVDIPVMDLGLLAPEYLATAVADAQRMFSGERLEMVVYEFVARDGTRKWAEISGEPLRCEGKVIGSVSVARDITGRKNAEESLRRANRSLLVITLCNEILIRAKEEESLLKQICTTIVERGGYALTWVAFAEHDAEKTIRSVSYAGVKKGYLELLDLSWADTEKGRGPTGTAIRTGQPIISRDIATDPGFAPWRDAALDRGFRSCISLPLISALGTLGALVVVSNKMDAFDESEKELLVQLADDMAFGIAAIRTRLDRNRARAEKEKVEAELRQIQRLESIGQLAGGVAHDFNNCLMGIKGFTQLALVETEESSPAYKDLLEVNKQADKAANITRQLLAFSRRQPLQPMVLDLNAQILDLRKMLGRLLEEDIKLTIETAQNLGRVKADTGQMDQILMNLAVNARHAMPKGGMLTLKTANVTLDQTYADRHSGVTPGKYVMMAVSDTGMGMDEATQSHIFEPFFTTKKLGEGTGLGLATVYGIVKQHDGHISVSSEPDKGATFNIYLPTCDDEPPSPEKETRFVPQVSVTGKILVVDDDPVVLKLCVRTLKNYGYSVLHAGNPDDAQRLFAHEGEGVGLLLTDVVLPGMNGRLLYENLKTHKPSLKVVYMSGYPENVIAERGIVGPEIILIQKPFEADRLVQVIEAVLAGSNP